eukprot:jgi/Undpi1/6764/HiC_scaffold_21.g09243.m1
MASGLSPYADNHADAVVSDKTFYDSLFKDEERCKADSPPPPHGGDGGGDTADGDVDKPSRAGTLYARVALAIGLLFEVSATLWAFQEAVSAGALDRDISCQDRSRARLFESYLIMETCTQIETDKFFTYTADRNLTYYEEYVSCDSPTDALSAKNSFDKLCSCPSDYNPDYLSPCSWVALSIPWDDNCYAQGVITNSSDETITRLVHPYGGVYDCWATNPSGIAAFTITAFVVALSSQLLEAFVGFKYWKDTDKRTALSSLAPAIFETLGVVVVSSVMLSLPGFYSVSDDTYKRLPVFLWLAWATVPIVVVGALAEIAMEFSDSAAGRLPYLGAVGSGMIWLGAALLEVVVISYLLWTGGGIRDIGEIAREAASFVALELLGLVSMWAAHGLWSRAKVLSAAVKLLKVPLRTHVSTVFE